MPSQVFPQPKPNPALGGLGSTTFNPSPPYPEGFGPAPEAQPSFPAPKLDVKPPAPQEESELSKYLNLYMPDTRATDMFMNLMDNMPVREKPGWPRRLLAGAVAMGQGGPEAGEQVLYDPYYRKLGDFKLRADLLKDLASAERSGNVNERLMLQSLLRQDVLERQQGTREAAQATREKEANARIEINRIRARLAEIREDKTLSDTQKLALQDKYRQDLERLRGDVRAGLIGEQAELDQELERIRQSGRLGVVAATGEERRRTEERKSELEAEGGELPTQTKVRQYNLAREVYNTDPEARRFLKIGSPGTNDFTIVPRNVFLSEYRPEAQAAAQAKYDEIVKKIYGDQAPKETKSGGTRTPTRTTPAAPKGRVSAADVLPPEKGGIMKRKVKSSKGIIYDVTSRDGGKTWELPDGRILETR